MSVNCDDIYRRTIPSLCPSVYTDGNCTSMYTKKITVEKEGMKKKIMCNFTNGITDEISRR